MIAALIKQFSDDLNDIAEKHGVSSGQLQSAELVDKISIGLPRAAVEKLRRITQEDFDRWFRTFGDALEITYSLQAGESSQSFKATHADHLASNLARLIAESEDLDRPIRLALSLQKDSRLAREIRSKIGAASANVSLLLFFSSQRLKAILEGYDFDTFEKQFLPKPGKLLFLVADADGKVDGNWITLLGRDQLDGHSGFLTSPPALDDLNIRRETMYKLCNWDMEKPKFLTPDFFQTKSERNQDLADCRGQLARLQNRLIVPYLSNHTRKQDSRLTCIFEGERSVELEVGNETGSTDLYGLYLWVYEEATQQLSRPIETKLQIARHVVAAEIPTGASFEDFVERTGKVLEEVEIQLKVLIDKNIVDSFERRQKVAKLVRDYTDEIGKRIQSLAKEVVDSTYKTAGLLAGVVIASLLKPDLSFWMILIATVLYIIYIFFIVFFYIRTLREDFNSKKRDFEEERKAIGELKLVAADKIFEPVAKRNSAFEKKYRSALWVHFVMVLAAALFAVLLCLGFARRDQTEEEIRSKALSGQAKRFEKFRFTDIRVNLKGKDRPLALAEQATGRSVVPDLTAIGGDSRLIVVRYLGCPSVGKSEELANLRMFQEQAQEKNAEFQLLIPAVCDRVPGPEKARKWLAAEGLSTPTIWAW